MLGESVSSDTSFQRAHRDLSAPWLLGPTVRPASSSYQYAAPSSGGAGGHPFNVQGRRFGVSPRAGRPSAIPEALRCLALPNLSTTHRGQLWPFAEARLFLSQSEVVVTLQQRNRRKAGTTPALLRSPPQPRPGSVKVLLTCMCVTSL